MVLGGKFNNAGKSMTGDRAGWAARRSLKAINTSRNRAAWSSEVRVWTGAIPASQSGLVTVTEKDKPTCFAVGVTSINAPESIAFWKGMDAGKASPRSTGRSSACSVDADSVTKSVDDGSSNLAEAGRELRIPS